MGVDTTRAAPPQAPSKGPGFDPNDPKIGYYRCRLVKNGPAVPAQVFLRDGPRDENGALIGDQELVGLVWGRNGAREVDPLATTSPNGWMTWWVAFIAGGEITKEEFDRMVATMDWARNTSAPEGNPEAPIDLTATAPISRPGVKP